MEAEAFLLSQNLGPINFWLPIKYYGNANESTTAQQTTNNQKTTNNQPTNNKDKQPMKINENSSNHWLGILRFWPFSAIFGYVTANKS